MAVSLTKHDLDVLEKIKDPESGPSSPLLIDSSLPRDPHVTDSGLYQLITQEERRIISSIQQLELQASGLEPDHIHQSILPQYLSCVRRLDELIAAHPNYASARNNRAQALRRIYGDGMLLQTSLPSAAALPLHPSATAAEVISASKTVLTDLDTAISLLTPQTPFASISAQAAKTLSQAYTQRGALYHLTAKHLPVGASGLRIDESRREAAWTRLEFEENASADFTRGGRYGNEIARALAVGTNPTAKLCGEMVREAMRKEYSGGMTA